MIYVMLFYTFFKIGLFGFGGGYAMVSLIQAEVVSRHAWISAEEFTDIIAVSQMTPGPIGINSATYVGYAATGSVWGAVVASVAVVLPSFILMLAISKLLLKYRESIIVSSLFRVLRPAVVGLLASAVIVLMNVANFSSPGTDLYMFSISCILFILTFVSTKWLDVNPILAIILAGVVGYIFL